MTCNNLNLDVISMYSEDQTREYLETLRWHNGRVCPHCSSLKSYSLKPRPNSNRPVRNGVYKCRDCKKQFTVTVGNIFEGSHIPLNKWIMTTTLITSSKKGMSANQLKRMLSITYKTAWFMAHRIRFDMTELQNDTIEKLSGIVETDETYIGGKAKGTDIHGRGAKKKMVVVALVERNGNVRSKPMDRLTAKNLKSYIKENVDSDSVIMTDDFKSYNGLENDFNAHYIIKHSEGEYVRGNVHTNTIEGYFSLLKSGVNSTFHHISKKHLHRYLDEFAFRYNLRKEQDGKITSTAILQSKGKRLMYRDSSIERVVYNE